MIVADRVSFRYPQDGTGLDPVSLRVQAGEFCLGVGLSGSGKSTLARCLSGLIPHLYRGRLEGDVRVDKRSTRVCSLHEVTEKVGLVFQSPPHQMLAPTVEDEILFGLENLGLSKGEIKTRLEESLQRFDLNPLRGRSPQNLSGGEQQKLALAAITARRPPHLILDEPLSMLDTTASMAFVDYLERTVRDGRAVVLFEHRDEWLEGVPGVRREHMPDGRARLPELDAPCPLPCGPEFSLHAKHLALHRGKKVVLHDLDFSARSGEWIAIVGKNGVGKTTLLRSLAGLQDYRGLITKDGRQNGRPADFGLVFESPDMQLFNASVRGEILYHLSDPDLPYYQWLIQALGLSAYEETSPLLLSEGEKKRLALATVMMRKPLHGLLLDEPSLGQDVVHKQLLTNVLRAY